MGSTTEAHVAQGELRSLAGDVRVHYLAAGALHQVGRVDEARAMAERARTLSPDDWSTLYNLACHYATAGDQECALTLLERAMKMGGGSPAWIRNDPDLDPLRELPRFKALMAGLRTDAGNNVSN